MDLPTDTARWNRMSATKSKGHGDTISLWIGYSASKNHPLIFLNHFQNSFEAFGAFIKEEEQGRMHGSI